MIEGITKHDFQNHKSAVASLLQEIDFIDEAKSYRIVEKITGNFAEYSSFSLFHFTQRRLSGAIFSAVSKQFTEVGRSIKICYMAVRKEFQGQSIARELIEHFIASAQHSFENIVLTTFEDNHRAIRFYSKFSFIPFTINKIHQSVLKDRGSRNEHRDLVFIRRFPLRNVLIRPLRTSNVDFLKEMLFRSLQTNGELFERSILESSELARYYDDWDSKKEIGFIARYNDKDIGAIWSRKLPFYNQGYGYVDDHIPEMGLAVYYEYRGRGLGQMLMEHLFTRLKHLGEEAVSVYTHKDNPAKRAYLRNQFTAVRREGSNIILVKKL